MNRNNIREYLIIGVDRLMIVLTVIVLFPNPVHILPLMEQMYVALAPLLNDVLHLINTIKQHY